MSSFVAIGAAQKYNHSMELAPGWSPRDFKGVRFIFPLDINREVGWYDEGVEIEWRGDNFLRHQDNPYGFAIFRGGNNNAWEKYFPGIVPDTWYLDATAYHAHNARQANGAHGRQLFADIACPHCQK